MALGGLGVPLSDVAMLYAGIAEGGTARGLRFVKDAPDKPAHRMFGPVASYYLREVLNGVALPDGWAMGQGLLRKRSIGFKTGTSYGYRDAWAVGFSNDSPWPSGWDVPTARRVRAMSGAKPVRRSCSRCSGCCRPTSAPHPPCPRAR